MLHKGSVGSQEWVWEGGERGSEVSQSRVRTRRVGTCCHQTGPSSPKSVHHRMAPGKVRNNEALFLSHSALHPTS